MRITPHFDTAEFRQRAWSKGPAVEYPKEWLKERLTPLCLALEVLREELDGKAMHILSGYRSEAFNKAISGAKLSQHVQGRAADVTVAGVPATRVWAVLQSLVGQGVIPQVRGIGLYTKQNFVHIDVRPTVQLATWGGDFSPSEA